MRKKAFSRTEITSSGSGDVWFFAYGSLLWAPELRVVQRCRAHLFGWHRRFCVNSIRYRGTAQAPGLVLGLDHGGSCVGLALKISASERDEVLAKLTLREMPEEIYTCRPVKLRISNRTISAITLIVNRDHRLYSPVRNINKMAERIASSVGDRGSNKEYLENTVSSLADAGINDCALSLLLDRVRGLG